MGTLLCSLFDSVKRSFASGANAVERRTETPSVASGRNANKPTDRQTCGWIDAFTRHLSLSLLYHDQQTTFTSYERTHALRI